MPDPMVDGASGARARLQAAAAGAPMMFSKVSVLASDLIVVLANGGSCGADREAAVKLIGVVLEHTVGLPTYKRQEIAEAIKAFRRACQ